MRTTATLGGSEVNRMGFGAMQLAGPGVFGPPTDPDHVKAVLRRAVELGVDHIDTSQYYGPDVVNALIHDSLHPYPDGLRLVTKVGARRDEQGGWLPAQTPSELQTGVEDNLRALELDSIFAVNLRLLDRNDAAAAVPIAEQLGALAELRARGKLELIGISNVTREQAEQALEIEPGIACVQNAYSVIDRSAQRLLDLCSEREIAFVPFFPLGSAFIGGPAKLAADPAIAGVAEKHGATPSQIALAWLLQRDPRILLIPGTSSLEHLEQNVAAAEIELDPADLQALDAVRQAGNPLGER
jgi:aryl-alcohol dehydrogenase-like predicted oxidoreductase